MTQTATPHYLQERRLTGRPLTPSRSWLLSAAKIAGLASVFVVLWLAIGPKAQFESSSQQQSMDLNNSGDESWLYPPSH